MNLIILGELCWELCWERFALLKSPRMIKIESVCICSVSVIRSASFCKTELTCAC